MLQEEKDKMNKLILLCLELDKQQKEIEEQLKCNKEQLKYYMKNAQTDTFIDDFGTKVTFKTHTRDSFDKQKFIEKYGENEYKLLLTTIEYESLKIMTKDEQERVKKLIRNVKK